MMGTGDCNIAVSLAGRLVKKYFGACNDSRGTFGGAWELKGYGICFLIEAR